MWRSVALRCAGVTPTTTGTSVPPSIIKARKQITDCFTNQSKPNTSDYTNLVRLYLEHRQPLAAKTVLDEMVTHNIPINGSFAAAYIKTFRRDIAGAHKFIEALPSMGTEATSATFTSLIDLHVENDDIEGAKAVMEKMRQLGLQPRVVAYSTLIKYHTKHRDLKSALEILEEMKAAGVAPNVVTFNTLLKCATRANQPEAVENLLSELSKFDAPDSITLLQLAELQQITRGNRQEFLALITRMFQNARSVDDLAIATVLQVFAHQNDVENSNVWMREVRRREIPIGLATASTLIRMYFRLSDLPAAQSVMLELSKNTAVAPSIANNMLARCLSNYTRFEKLLEPSKPLTPVE